jgi:HSP20 family protein
MSMAQQKQPQETKPAGREGALERARPSQSAATPFSLMRRMMQDFERMFDEPLFGGGMRPAMQRGPAIDVFERDDKLVVRADVPGYAKDDIKLEVTEEGVVIEGERQNEREEKDGGYYRRERTYGSFRRLIPLPDGIDVDSVRAEMKNGVLEVCFALPQQQRKERKRIQISEGAEQPGEKKSVH